MRDHKSSTEVGDEIFHSFGEVPGSDGPIKHIHFPWVFILSPGQK